MPTSCPPPSAATPSAIDVQSTLRGPQGYAETRGDPTRSWRPTPPRPPSAPDSVVLLGQRGDRQGVRYLLAASSMRLSHATVQSALVERGPDGTFNVAIRLRPATSESGTTWRENFHALVAFDLGGSVVSAPVIEPTQSSFSSFGGSIVVSGGLVSAQVAHTLAADVTR